MKMERWHKKDVTLTWNGQQTSLAVAQELFSSHDVDSGSRLLLRSLDLDALAQEGDALDFGCGYGVLGLALRQQAPGWRVTLVDRDALALAFARANAGRLDLDDGSTTFRLGLGPDESPPGGWTLVLWNVPGKAGEPVIARLVQAVADSLADGGVVALVVVHPLADTIRAELARDEAMTVTHDEGHAEHTVIHARRSGAGPGATDPFDQGVFDREPAGFGVDDFDYDIRPVFGLPEYDSYSFASQLMFDQLRAISWPVGSMLVLHPGQGHVPLVAAHRLRPSRLTLLDRDQLALRASVRAMAEQGPRVRRLEIVATPDLIDVPPGGKYELALLMLEDQVRNEIHVARLDDLSAVVELGGMVIAAGQSSVVSRFLSFAAKTRQWKARDRARRGGASAARLERVG